MFWSSRSPSGFLAPAEVVSAYDQGVGALLDPARYLAGFNSGLDALDRLAGGLRRGTLTLLSGEAGVGKTSLALAYVRRTALVDGAPTAILSPACTGEHLLLRLLAAETRIPLGQFTTSGLDAIQRDAALDAWNRVSRSPLFINDLVECDLQETHRNLRAFVQRSAVHFVVVDEVRADTTRGWFRRPPSTPELLAGVAQELHVAVLVLGRASAANDRAIWDQHSERIIELQPTSSTGQVEVLVQRNCFGPIGQITLRLNPDCLAFEA